MRCKLLKVGDRWALPTVPGPCAEKLFEIDKKQKCPPVRMDTAVAARSEPAARLPLEHARRLRAEAGELREVGVGPAHLGGWGGKYLIMQPLIQPSIQLSIEIRTERPSDRESYGTTMPRRFSPCYFVGNARGCCR